MQRTKDLEHQLGLSELKNTTNERLIRELTEQLRQEKEEREKREELRNGQKSEFDQEVVRLEGLLKSKSREAQELKEKCIELEHKHKSSASFSNKLNKVDEELRKELED